MYLAIPQLNFGMDTSKQTTAELNPHAKAFTPMAPSESLYTSVQIAPDQPNQCITAMTISPDKQWLSYATGSNIIVRNAQTTELVDKFTVSDRHPIHSLAMNDKIIVSQSRKSKIKIWQMHSQASAGDIPQAKHGNKRKTVATLRSPKRQNITAFAIPANTDGVTYTHGSNLTTWQAGQMQDKEHHEEDTMLLLKMKLLPKYPNILQHTLNQAYLNVLNQRIKTICDTCVTDEPDVVTHTQENYMATASKKKISLWHTLSGQRLGTIQVEKDVSTLAISDANTITTAAGLEDGSVCIWHVKKPRLVQSHAPQTQNSSSAASSAYQPSAPISPVRTSNSPSASQTPPPQPPSPPTMTDVEKYLATRDDFIGRFYAQPTSQTTYKKQ